MATIQGDLTSSRYRAIRRQAVATIAERVIRDPPSGDETDLEFLPYVRDWLEAEYEDRLGGYDPSVVESVVPADPKEVDAAAETPMVDEEADENRRQLHALHAVRADFVVALEDDADAIRRAIAVHDALERLVGERDGRTDRRPSGIVEAFADWVERERGEAVAERARTSFTPLHVMRIAALPITDGGDDRDLLRALETWLGTEHPGIYEPVGSGGVDDPGADSDRTLPEDRSGPAVTGDEESQPDDSGDDLDWIGG